MIFNIFLKLKVKLLLSGNRPGKNRQNGKLLAGKSCDLEGKNKEIHKGNHPTLEGNLPCWIEVQKLI